ncbi:glycoside hydrolase [Sphingomonas sp. Leaf34]|uniref:glycoside hydrolase n=1 Tax=Sphingomonas sp. Leaf34 TaxID=1736216 RepID=UPI0009E7520D|nr:glycoside hydrolase [Sphingomonas sp. Leaf34]
MIHSTRRIGITILALVATPSSARIAPPVQAPPIQAPAIRAAPVQDGVAITLRPAIDRPGTEFEGWGTALAWFANVTGGYPDATRERLADLFYGKQGLGWTIARYNIGGGNAATTLPYLRTGAAVPGFWRQPAAAVASDWWRPEDPAMWDWSADANQRWWLDAIKHRVAAPIFEAFSNSPPAFMTVSGRVSGAVKGTDDNLRPGQERPFATYLARVVGELERRHQIRFRTLSPVNEPNTDYWFAANTQEGAHWSPARQATMIDATAAALDAAGLDTAIAAPDETNAHLFVADWAAYPPATRARIGQLNVHSYGTVHQTAVRDIARAANIRLWMSEDDTPLDKDPESFVDMASGLAFGEHVVQDLKRLEPAAWVFWQAVENFSGKDGKPGSNWGLVKMDLNAAPAAPHPIQITPKYWVMASFSRYLRPGYRLVPVDDADTIGASSPDGRTLILVHVNGGSIARRLTIALPNAQVRDVVVTDATHHAASVGGSGAATIARPRSVTTILLDVK